MRPLPVTKASSQRVAAWDLAAPFSGSTVQDATSLTGHPSVAIQNGFDSEGKPTGIQFIGQLYDEAGALTLARHYQQRTEFHRRHPPAFS